MALSWAEQVQRGGLTVKGARATVHQAHMMFLIVTTTKARGGDLESQAGAVATAIQESTCTNMSGGDRDSQGLYQQRPSMGWGSVAQIRTPTYAIGKFLDQFLAYRRKCLGWLDASHRTQRSAFASAPAKWYAEALKGAKWYAGAGDDAASLAAGTLTGDGGGTSQETRALPYEFSRGTVDKKEDSWDCMGRLADEVNWRRFMRRGTLWFCSEKWLEQQRPIYRLQEFSRGVLSLSYEFETRREAAEATLRCQAKRYAIAPGDAIELYSEGPASGLWLVSNVHRRLASSVAEVTLKRAGAKLPEPAPQTETKSVSVAGSEQTVESGGGGSVSGSDPAARVYQAAVQATALNWLYSQPRRNHNDRYADCSSGVTWVLRKAGISTPPSYSGNAPVSGSYIGWGQPGPGKQITIYTNAGHIWIRWNGIGPAWRFDTSGYGDSYQGSSGGRNRSTPRPTAGFVARHFPGL